MACDLIAKRPPGPPRKTGADQRIPLLFDAPLHGLSGARQARGVVPDKNDANHHRQDNYYDQGKHFHASVNAQAAESTGGRGTFAAAGSTSRVPGVVIDHSPASSGIYIGSPSLAVISATNYVASHDGFGPNSTEHTRAITRIFGSRDGGQSWTNLARVDGQFWSTLFVHHGALYLIGTDRHHGHAIIRRSTDSGRSWTSRVDAANGLLSNDTEFHCAPGWGITYCAGVLSASVDANLLNATNWTFSLFLPGDTNWLGGSFGGWLEGNIVETPDGRLVDVLRVDTPGLPERAAIVRISEGGKSMVFDLATGFVDFPGGAKKFTIRFDKRGRRFWSLASVVEPQPRRAGRPATIRNTLVLICSPDLVHWTSRGTLLHHPDTAKHGFQYVDWQFEGDDIIAVCRTAYDDSGDGAHNAHDANFLTFHRVRNFRSVGDPLNTPSRAEQ